MLRCGRSTRARGGGKGRYSPRNPKVQGRSTRAREGQHLYRSPEARAAASCVS